MPASRTVLTAPWILSALALGCVLSFTPATTSAAAQDEGQGRSKAATNNDADEDSAEEAEEKLQELKLADGRLVLQAPADWEKQQPSIRFIEVELEVPAKEKDAADPGRLTIMRAGGSVEANIERWYGQFRQPDGKSSKEAAKVEEQEVDGLNVHVIDLGGTFLDRPGPFAPGTEREGYRMLAAIIETDGEGNYFVKLTGPQETLKQNEKAFARMVEGLQWRE